MLYTLVISLDQLRVVMAIESNFYQSWDSFTSHTTKTLSTKDWPSSNVDYHCPDFPMVQNASIESQYSTSRSSA